MVRSPVEAGPVTWDFDFREGGREYNSGQHESGATHTFDAIYHDIVENERIVYSYVMYADGNKLSASLATVELEPAGDGTLVTITEHGAYFDGFDSVESRESGTGYLLDALGASLGS
jgi:uncharacterized protein YndB with AHSA1/START domain